MTYTLARIYKMTHDEGYLTNAVSKGWITNDEKLAIIAAAN